MGASVFVGRVGGLAVALGVGAAVFSSGLGAAWADSEAPADSATSAPAVAATSSGGAPAASAARAGRTGRATTLRTTPRKPLAPAGRRGLATASVTATDPLAVAPTTLFFDGVIQGNLNVTGGRGCGSTDTTCSLVYSLTGTSDGGKVNLPTTGTPKPVPDALPGGGLGSYTFLPKATWIDPDNPSRNALPSSSATGAQTFTVRVAESTQLDQTLTKLPLIGGISKKTIDALQDAGLLVGLIGAAVTATVSVNPYDLAVLPGGVQQVAYTYTVSSWDGTPISTNYFPASLSTQTGVKPYLGNQQATIFNGPGLGSAGTTAPYELYQENGAVPSLALMRGQGLPSPLTSAPVGFNVITWDPRGEWDSGGILQLDNPFYEGRDVTALIDWANANTPLLNENALGALASPCSPGDAGCNPDVAMLGGSYGGLIQMTTVDPRIKSIVPSIAPNSLNQSLYPTNSFKTGWANTLAAALLLTGASSLSRINSQITVALATGNLFNYISPSGQAVLSSSGPTSLLTKLNVPTLYNQGIVDALFPLQQALQNAQTQLEQNPYFADKPGQVKMIWFNGGHGIPTNVLLLPDGTAKLTAQTTLMFLEDMIWANNYTKNYLGQIPTGLPSPYPATLKALTQGLLAVTPAFQWWDQNGTALASYSGMPYTDAFQDTPPIAVTGTGPAGSLRSLFTQASGPLTSQDAAGAICTSVASACEFPLNQVFATESKDAINVDIPVPATTDPLFPSVVVGTPTVSFTYSGRGNAKAIYGQIVDNATGQVLGNIVTPIPVTLSQFGTPQEYTVTNFPLANIAYTAPEGADGSLTLQLVAKSSLYKNNDVIWNIDISNLSVSLPTTDTAIPNPVPDFLPF